MLRRLLSTADDRTLLVIRVVLGLVMLPHGLPKTLGWFGGGGWSGTMAHWKVGFFMDWGGKLTGEGYEYALLAIGMGAVLVLGGGGKWSVDRWLATRS